MSQSRPEQTQIISGKKRRRFSLRIKLILGFSLMAAFISFITVGGIYTNLQNQISNEFKNHLLGITKVAALQQNGDEFIKISSDQDPLYEKFRLQNTKIRNSDPDIVFVYTMRKGEQGISFVVDAGERSDEGFSAFNERYTDPGPTLVENFDVMKEAIVEPEFYTDEYGTFLSAYAPIFSSDGTRVGVIGVDILANTVIQQQRTIFFQSVLVFLIAVALGIFFGYLAGNALTKPVIKLMQGTLVFASGKFDQRIEINSTDEISDLANTFNSMAEELQGLIDSLEFRVAERTKELAHRTTELEQITKQSEKRADQLQAVTGLASHISIEKDMEKLLPLITQTVSERFGYYHIGIFLLNENKKFAVLRAANSPGGQKMLERQHKLEVGQVGIVGNVTSTGRPRIALDTGADAVFFSNPDLPDTRSEMALPLIARETTIGALDVQSTLPNAFTAEDISILSLLADQIAIAIDNANLLDETHKALTELQAVTREYIADTWQKKSTSDIFGYHQTVTGGQLITGKSAQKMDAPVEAEKGMLTMPITLHDQVIGTLNVRPNTDGRAWSTDEVNIVQAVTERLGLALDNARLFEETSSRASREHLVSDITAKIRNTNDPEEMVKTAVEELKRALNVSRIEILPKNNIPPAGQ